MYIIYSYLYLNLLEEEGVRDNRDLYGVARIPLLHFPQNLLQAITY